MDGSLHTVVHFQVQLGQLVLLIGTRFFDITQRTGVNNVAHDESLNGLVLGDGFSRRDTANTLHVTAALLVTPVITSLHSHVLDQKLNSTKRKKEGA